MKKKHKVADEGVAAPEVKGPESIADNEVKYHQSKQGGARDKEIARRMQIDPDKSQAEIEKEYDAKVAAQEKIDGKK